ncbi:MAG: tRNA (guanine-N7-)-methyltransferase [Thermoproteota archaeon]|jgi:tRNA (guanine-N7-)-methyltransferase
MSEQIIKKKKIKDPEKNYSYKEDFEYKHDNPYDEKLKVFDSFVMRDSESESYLGDWNKSVFKKEAPLVVEIGTGFGYFMHEYCEANPEINFVGMDYRFKRSFTLAKKLDKIKNKNFKYLRAKGERIRFMFGENEVDEVLYFFPDPWPKARHNKKRLFQKPFLDSCHKILKTGGVLHVKTDHDVYFDWMLDILETELTTLNRFDVELKSFDLHKEHPEHVLSEYKTKFEKMFIEQGTNIKSLVLRKK